MKRSRKAETIFDQYPEDVQADAIRELIKNQYANSLALTAIDLCGFSEIVPHCHGKMIRALEDMKTLRKLVVMPRGTFKSSIGSVAYPIWLLIRNPNLRILIDSEVYSNSITYLRLIKNIVLSDPFRKVCGDWEGPVWNEGEITIKARNLPKKEASITCGGVETVKVGQHYDVIIGDDYNSPKNSNTPENRLKIIEHYRYNQAILDPGGIYVIIGTRYCSGDLIGNIIENEIEVKDALSN